KDAVIGVYVKMSKPELYGKTLTWHVNEFVSQNYARVSGASDLNVLDLLYDNSPFVSYRNSIWKNGYEVIANINNILNYEEKNRAILTPVIDSLVRGELLGIRALMHFDLLRMFGKGNLGGRPELLNTFSIPYSLQFNKYAPAQVTYEQFLAYLRQDIEEAIEYLRVDPIIKRKDVAYYLPYTDQSFLATNSSQNSIIDRKFRMNYYAAQALYARILMWEGSEEAQGKALIIAEDLIKNANYYWTNEVLVIVKNNEWWKSDLLFRNEHLFTMAVEKLADYQTHAQGTRNWFDASSPGNTYQVVYLTQAKAEEIYETPGIGDTDWRYIYCLLPQGSSMNNFGLVKLRQHTEQTADYSRSIPMIRITEMFYIAAECRMEAGINYDRTKALEYLNTVRKRRGIAEREQLTESLTDEQIKQEIYKEYRKEFVGEGQVFFYYKRKGLETIPGYNGTMTDAQYQYPMPDDEIALGGRIK
ncbi:MAG: RagB/SusD family nutrient uptake outer membrane protein, partial [Odoribacter sp.]|nr:RagB/SusD family nutrient uptake outer membrane protein [Odoribacter sp.]